MAERKFIIVKLRGKVPAMASCAKCQRKFFTLPTFYRDAVGAAEYLRGKFDAHQCPEQPEEREPIPTWLTER